MRRIPSSLGLNLPILQAAESSQGAVIIPFLTTWPQKGSPENLQAPGQGATTPGTARPRLAGG